MILYMTDKDTGKYICKVKLSGENVLNSDWIPVEHPPTTKMDYYDGTKWVTPEESPNPNFSFDYERKEWIDPRTIDDIKAHKWDEIKAQRGRLEFGGFAYKGNFYDSDQVSQGRIMGAAVAGIPQTWTLANNTTVDLTADELRELYAALQAHISAAHERGRLARQKIDVALTFEEVENVQL